MLHKARHTQSHEPIAHVDVNHHLGTPQHGGSLVFNMDIPNEERVTHQCETFLNPASSTRSRKSGGRHLLANEALPSEGVEGSKAIYYDCRDFLRQR
ncbi:hypothetical protein ACFX1R_042435 [Malus domestica]